MRKEKLNIILTGSSSGIGKYLAERLLKLGHSIWGLARRYEEEQAEISKQLILSKCDVANWSSVCASFKKISTHWEYVDALILCAGTQGVIGKAMELNPMDWEKTINLNISGTFFPIRACFELLMKSSRRKKIICFSGGGATSPRPNFSAYAVAKTGVVRLTETLAKEWEDLPLDINAVAPGAIATPMIEEIVNKGPSIVGNVEYGKALEILKNGGGSLEKVFNLVEFLLSETSNGISGKLFAAQWDDWSKLKPETSDRFTLRRIT